MASSTTPRLLHRQKHTSYNTLEMSGQVFIALKKNPRPCHIYCTDMPPLLISDKNTGHTFFIALSKSQATPSIMHWKYYTPHLYCTEKKSQAMPPSDFALTVPTYFTALITPSLLHCHSSYNALEKSQATPP